MSHSQYMQPDEKIIVGVAGAGNDVCIKENVITTCLYAYNAASLQPNKQKI